MAEWAALDFAIVAFSLIGLAISITHIIRTFQLRRNNILMERIFTLKKMQLIGATDFQLKLQLAKWEEEDGKNGP